MSTTSLSTVANDVVGRYAQVGKIIVGTYRTGAQRLHGAANTRYAEFLHKLSLPLVNDDVKASLIGLQRQFAGTLADGIENGSQRAEKAMEFIADGVNGGIRRASRVSERVQSAFDTRSLSTLASVAVPVAQVSLEIAQRAVEGTTKLSRRVLGSAAENGVATKATAKRSAKKPVARRSAKART
jgi:hypothetical protein